MHPIGVGKTEHNNLGSTSFSRFLNDASSVRDKLFGEKLHYRQQLLLHEIVFLHEIVILATSGKYPILRIFLCEI